MSSNGYPTCKSLEMLSRATSDQKELTLPTARPLQFVFQFVLQLALKRLDTCAAPRRPFVGPFAI